MAEAAALGAAGAPEGGAGKRLLARPPHRPAARQRRQVAGMVQQVMPQRAIAAVLGIGDDALRRHYAEEPRRGDGIERRKPSTKFEGADRQWRRPGDPPRREVKLMLTDKVRVEHSGEVRGGLDAYLTSTEQALRKRFAPLAE